jgi:glycosyltransferase 2 family protein
VKRALSITLKLGISSLLLWLLLRRHDLRMEIAPRLALLLENWPWTLAGLLAAFAALAAAAARWWLLVRGFAPQFPWLAMLRVELSACFFNVTSVSVIGGDAFKIMAMSRRLPGEVPRVGVSLMLDHVAGFVALGLMFLSCLALQWSRWEMLGQDARMLLLGYGGYMGVALLGMIVSWITFKPNVLAWGKRTFPRVLGSAFFAKLSSKLEQAHDLILELRGRMLGSVVLAVLLYLAVFTAFYCALRAVGGNAPFLDVTTAMPVVDAIASLPISFSGLGVRERTFEMLMSGFAGVEEAVCVSAAFAGWLFTVFWGLVGGLLFLIGGKKHG